MAVLVIGVVIAITLLLGLLGRMVGSQTSVLSAVTVATPAIDPQLQAQLLGANLGGSVEEDGADDSVALVPGGAAAVDSATPLPPFAAVDDIALHLPLTAPGGLVFLEADSASALPLAPLGTMTANDNPNGYTPNDAFVGPAFADPEFVIHEPLSGVRPATGMAAILAAPGTSLLAPVQGTIASVTSRSDASGTQEWAVAISPESRPDRYVVIRRIASPMVEVGDPVTVGMTPIGTVGSAVVIKGTHNPLSLPSALVHVQPAIEAVEVLAPK